jgi:predicted lysophospholipase L1 biosynthesis ABC-type transport system permease subunit
LLAEYGALAGLLALVALALGSGLGWLIVVELFSFDFLPDWTYVLAVLGGGLVLVLAFALGGSLPLLRTRPAKRLESFRWADFNGKYPPRRDRVDHCHNGCGHRCRRGRRR